MATLKLDQIDLDVRIVAARLEECKRFAAVLQRVGRLNGALAVHYDNRCQALEIERDRLDKLRRRTLREMINEKPQQNY